MPVIIRGATLAGMAAAARLARLGHDVVLATDGTPPGGRWAPAGDGPAGHVVDALPQVFALPAAWRDLFKKSGAHLQTELNRAGLDLVPAPAARHLFRDQDPLELPTERGAQFRAVEARFGGRVLTNWRALVDALEGVWHAYRRHALEGTLPVTRAARRMLWLDRPLGEVARGLGPALGRVVTDLGDSPHAPGVLALPLYVEQTFGRWQLVDRQGGGRRASLLVDLLRARLDGLGVRILRDAPEADVDCRPLPPPGHLLRRAPRPAPAPLVTHELRAGDGAADVRELVDHSGDRPVVSWARPVADGLLVTTHDHRRPTPDPGWGLAADSAGGWLARPPIVGGRSIRASAYSPAGPAPWAELGSAALAVYELHERLTGQDSRPTNRDFRPPVRPARPGR